MPIYLVFLLPILFILYVYFKNKKRNDLINKIPGPPALPLLGNLLMFNVPTVELWNALRNLNKNYYPIAKFWLGPYPVISIQHPDDIEILLSNPKYIEKGDGYKFLYPWLKTGLLTSTGRKWQQRRKILTPAFHFKILRKYMDVTNDNGKKFIEALKSKNKETVQNLVPFCSNYTLNIICESAMGIDLDKIDKKIAKEYKNAIYDVGNIIIYRVVRPYIQDWMLNPLWEIGRKHKKTLKTLHTFTNKVLTERKEYNKHSDNVCLEGFSDGTKSVNSEEDSFMGRKKKLAMLDLLLLAEQDGLIEDEGIKEEVDTFMFAGHDTTGMALVFTIMLLAENKEIQEKARAEVVEVLDKSKGEITATEIREFQYVERCVKESLRLFPPASAVSRCVQEDIQLKNYVIPAGTEIGCHIVDLHRNPQFWTNPETYDPDRFLPERIQGRHPYSYIPFSAGPRNCIGQKFAVMELKSLVARILYNFELEPITRTSDMKLVLDLVTRPSEPVYTRFVRIDSPQLD